MRKRLAVIVSLFALVTLASSSSPAGAHTGTGDDGIAFGAVRLTGAQEVPGPGDADGRGAFVYLAAGDKLCYLLTAHKIDTPVAAHIHSGVRGEAGGIAVGLEVPAGGISAACITAVPDTTPDTPDVLLRSELDAIISDPAGFYANVHTATFPAGAIRGQLR